MVREWSRSERVRSSRAGREWSRSERVGSSRASVLYVHPPLPHLPPPTTTPGEWCTIEHWISLICLYIGSVYYALVISNLSFIVGNMNRGKATLRDRIWTVNEYMRSKKTPASLRDKVRGFYKIQYGEGKMYNEYDILSQLSPNLLSEIMTYNQRHLFDLVPLIDRAPTNFANGLAPKLVSRIHFAGELVFEEDHNGNEMYVGWWWWWWWWGGGF